MHRLQSMNMTTTPGPSKKFIYDIQIILDELILYRDSIHNITIYDVIISCGHSLIYEDYSTQIDPDDIIWFENEGKVYFVNKILAFVNANTATELQTILTLYEQLLTILKLQS
jgi:hypothetical protein